MARQQALKSRVQERFNVLRALRDEIRLDLHLASMGLRDEWKELERKLPDASQAAGQLKGATSKTLDRLASELKQFQARIRKLGVREAGVARIMTRTVATCRPSDSLASAVTAMWQGDVGFLPVIGDDGVVVGVLTDRDAAVAACTRGKRMDEVAVETVMTRELVSCTDRDEITDALRVMRARRVRRLPVLDQQGRLVGVVTLADAARAFRGTASAAAPASRKGDAQGHEAGHIVLTLVEITEPSRQPASAPGN
jgi:CBS domain-containing protein